MFTANTNKVLRASVCVSAMLCFANASAQEQSRDQIQRVAPGTTLTLRDAVVRVLDVNPKLQGQKFSIAAAEARRDQAKLRPAFEVGVEVEDIFGTDNISTFSDSTTTLQLSTVLELGGKRASRVGAAERERELLLTTLDAEKLDVVAEVTRRFIRLVAAQRELSLNRQSIDLAGSTRKTVTQRVNAGAGAPLEQRNAEITLARAEIEKARAETALLQARYSLAAMWGGDGDDVAEASAELFSFAHLMQEAELDTLLQQNPNLTKFASERRVEEAKLRLAESQATPDVSVGAGIRRLQGERSNAFMLSFSMPLGTGARSAPYTAEARSRLQEVDYKEQAARAELKATLWAFYREAMQRDDEVKSLRDRAVPQAESAVQLAQNGFSAGRYGLLELLNAQQQLIDLQREAITAGVAYHNAVIEIERLTARSALPAAANQESVK